MTFRRVALGAALLAATLVPRPAGAQANYKLAPVGGRTTLVGGTGLVYGQDSASAFLNPATVVRIDSGRLAFSVNFYQLSLVSAPSWYQPGPIDRARFGDVRTEGADMQNFDFDTLPGSLCIYLKVADIPFLAREATKELREKQARLGMCLASVQNGIYSYNAEDYNQSGAFGVSRQAVNLRQSFRRIAIGPTYSMYIDNALAVGASMHFSRTSHRSFIGNTSALYGGATPISSIFYNASRGDSHELSFTLGATYRIGRRQTVALAVEVPSLHLFGSGGINNYTHYDTAGQSATSSFAAQGSFTAQSPLRVALGTGIEEKWGSAEINVSYHMPLGKAYRAELEGRSYASNGAATDDRAVALDLSARSRGAVNIGAGGEYFLSPQVSLLGGVGTDVSVVPGGALGTDPFNYYAAQQTTLTSSIGVGSHGPGGDLLIGGELSYGWGERLAVNAYQLPNRIETTEHRQYALLFVIAGSTSFRNIKRAVEDVTKMVVDPLAPKKSEPAKPAPANDPAKDLLPKNELPKDWVPKMDPPAGPPPKPKEPEPPPAKP